MCDGCIHLKCTPMVCRGIMDCDPPEIYCELDLCEEDCENYEEYDYIQEQWGYDDYLIAQEEARRQER